MSLQEAAAVASVLGTWFALLTLLREWRRDRRGAGPGGEPPQQEDHASPPSSEDRS